MSDAGGEERYFCVAHCGRVLIPFLEAEIYFGGGRRGRPNGCLRGLRLAFKLRVEEKEKGKKEVPGSRPQLSIARVFHLQY